MDFSIKTNSSDVVLNYSLSQVTLKSIMEKYIFVPKKRHPPLIQDMENHPPLMAVTLCRSIKHAGSNSAADVDFTDGCSTQANGIKRK